MKLLKTAGLNFWFNATATVLTFVATILMIVTNSTQGYALQSAPLGIAFAVLAVLFACGATVLVLKFADTHFIPSLVGLAALVFNVVAIAVMILGRANLVASLFTFDAYNNIGWKVFNVSITSLVFFLLAELVLIVGSFLSRKEKA